MIKCENEFFLLWLWNGNIWQLDSWPKNRPKKQEPPALFFSLPRPLTYLV